MVNTPDVAESVLSDGNFLQNLIYDDDEDDDMSNMSISSYLSDY